MPKFSKRGNKCGEMITGKRKLTLELGSGVSVTMRSAGSLSETAPSAVAVAADATNGVEFVLRENWREE